ncbi:GSCOCT00013511001.2-RA-CDS [Cotesia congregata]|uniref:CLIP domain-containing serine protease n=1 Tax=Cotesia congregata TaxID=51543 RepID=A0A8J2H5T2_COTCN|nr:GSCOCT00013511001.2-RA-CDS [Cotesia congregata]CAG5075999.1 venom protease-like [Cotesia congregata]
MKLLILFSYILITISARKLLTENSCETPREEIGVCIPVVECPSIVNILRGRKPLSDATLRFLRQSQCGLEGEMPFVCCTDSVEKDNLTIEASELVPNPPDVSNHPNLRLLDHELCGPMNEAKVYRGKIAGIFDHPWMALLVYLHRGKKKFGCGGTVISKRYILTAAHCVKDLPSGRTLFGVRVGEHDWSTKRDCDVDKNGLEIMCSDDSYQDFLVQSTKFHPDFKLSTLRNDIGLIRLHKNIDFLPINAKPICLPIEQNQKMDYKTLSVTGWGATEFDNLSKQLLRADVQLLPIKICTEALGLNSVIIWYKETCAVGINGGDSASGDSGGPLLSTGRYYNDARVIQHGIISYGMNNYGIYTSVAYYMDWILDNLDK